MGDDGEEIDAPFAYHPPGHVHPPDRVHTIRHDGAVVVAPGALAAPVRGLQAVFYDDPPHAPPRGADAPHPRMDHPVAFATEVETLDVVAGVRGQIHVAARSLRRGGGRTNLAGVSRRGRPC